MSLNYPIQLRFRANVVLEHPPLRRDGGGRLVWAARLHHLPNAEYFQNQRKMIQPGRVYCYAIVLRASSK